MLRCAGKAELVKVVHPFRRGDLEVVHPQEGDVIVHLLLQDALLPFDIGREVFFDHRSNYAVIDVAKNVEDLHFGYLFLDRTLSLADSSLADLQTAG